MMLTMLQWSGPVPVDNVTVVRPVDVDNVTVVRSC